MDGQSRPSVPTLTFLGGARTVTGSRFLRRDPDRHVCSSTAGSIQGDRELRGLDCGPFPVAPAEIDAVVLTHAHVDHCGYLPALERDGFDGPVIATPDTASLAAIVLPDSGHLQEEEAALREPEGLLARTAPPLPLYTEADAERALAPAPSRSRSTRPGRSPTGVTATLRPAGHILGSATVALDLARPGGDAPSAGGQRRSRAVDPPAARCPPAPARGRRRRRWSSRPTATAP